jgi:hypothetical protein
MGWMPIGRFGKDECREEGGGRTGRIKTNSGQKGGRKVCEVK